MKRLHAFEERASKEAHPTGTSGTFLRKELAETRPASEAYSRALELFSDRAACTDMRDLLRLLPQIFEGVVKIEIDLERPGSKPLQLMSAVVDSERVFFTTSSDRGEPFAARKVPLMLMHGDVATSIGDMYVLGFRPISLDPASPNDVVETERILERIGSLMAKTIDAALDGLTALPIRKYFDRSIAERSARFRTDGKAFSLILIDLDHFKKVNDDFGHPVGDRVLSETAAVLMNSIRGRAGSMDTLFRTGGEEFAVLLSDAPPDEASRIAERLRSGVKEHDYGLKDASGSPRQVTCSVGVADVREVLGSADLSEAIYKLADERLYRAKKGGRDSVIGMKAVNE